ncbi:MAG: substrate-binding domain-containing protein [bacterium]
MKNKSTTFESHSLSLYRTKHVLRTVLMLGILTTSLVFAQSAKSRKEQAKKPALTVVGSVAGRVAFAAPLANDFRQKHKIDLKVHSGGSELGIQSISDRFADIAISSRPLTEEEHSKGLQDTLVAYDAIAVVANKNHPLSNISIQDLQKILLQKIRTWDKLGGPEIPIKILMPDTSSGLRTAFFNKSLHGKKLKLEPMTLSSTYEVISVLRQDTLAIGICSATQMHFRHLKVLQIDGIHLGHKSIADGSYPFIVPVSLVTAGAPDANESLFIDWVLFGPASKLVTQNFFLSPVQQTAQATQSQEE